MHGVPTAELSLVQEQEERHGPDGAQEILPVVQTPYAAQGNQVVMSDPLVSSSPRWGASVNGKPLVSKTRTGGSIPPAPVSFTDVSGRNRGEPRLQLIQGAARNTSGDFRLAGRVADRSESRESGRVEAPIPPAPAS